MIFQPFVGGHRRERPIGAETTTKTYVPVPACHFYTIRTISALLCALAGALHPAPRRRSAPHRPLAHLIGLANDALSRKPALPAGPALVEPLNDDRRDHPDTPAQKIRHPRDVRILPPSRDFH